MYHECLYVCCISLYMYMYVFHCTMLRVNDATLYKKIKFVYLIVRKISALQWVPYCRPEHIIYICLHVLFTSITYLHILPLRTMWGNCCVRPVVWSHNDPQQCTRMSCILHFALFHERYNTCHSLSALGSHVLDFCLSYQYGSLWGE